MNIGEFVEEQSMLIDSFQAKLDKTNSRGNLENIPYVMFLEFYKIRPFWEMHIQNVESPFMKLL